MHLKRNILNEIIEKSIQDVILESIANPEGYGKKGPITCLIPAKNFVDIPQTYLNIIDSGSRSLNPYKLDSYFGDTMTYKLYTQYKNAMETKKTQLGRTAISFFLFLNRLRHGFKGVPMSIFDYDGSYMVGVQVNGVFLCVYMAPKSRMSMYMMIKALLDYDNVVFSVTEDLADMLKKLRVPRYKDKVNAKFRGRMCEKAIFGSTEEAAEKGAQVVGLAANVGSLKHKMSNQSLANLKSNPNLVSQAIANPGMIQQYLSNNGNNN